MDDDQKQWWADFIDKIKEDAGNKCEQCHHFRTTIQSICVDMAAANRAGNNDEFNTKRRAKTAVEKELKEHIATVDHGQHDIPIVSPLLQGLRFPSSAVTAPAVDLHNGTGDEEEPPAPVSLPPRPSVARANSESDRWPCFAGRPEPLVTSKQLPMRLRKGTPGLKVGDLAVVRVDPDDEWQLPFKVGEVLTLDEAEEQVVLALYGNTGANAEGAFTKGKWHEESKTISWSKKKLRGGGYSDYKLVCEPDCFVDWGFKLRTNGKLLKQVLDVITHNKRVPWPPE